MGTEQFYLYKVVINKNNVDYEYTSGDVEIGYVKANYDLRYSAYLYFGIPDTSQFAKNHLVDLNMVFGGATLERDKYTLAYVPGGTDYYKYTETEDILSTTVASATNAYTSTGGAGILDLEYPTVNSQHLYLGSVPQSFDEYVAGNFFIDKTGRYIRVYLAARSDYATSRDRIILHNIENIFVEINYEGLSLIPDPVYPKNVNIKSSKSNVFTWGYSSNYYRYGYNPQSSSVIISNDTYSHEFAAESDNRKAIIPADSIPAGEYEYKIKMTNTYGTTFYSSTEYFTSAGVTGAPDITSVTQDSFPTVSWTSSNQKAWQLVVRGINGVVFNSGMRSGTDQSFKLPIMIENGSYYAEVRNLNKYGYYTEWGTYGFVLEPTSPSAPTNIIVSVRNDYGVSIDCKAPSNAGTLYVIRRQRSTDPAVVIGEYKQGFIDYTIPINTTFEYTVRNYSTGCADGEWIDATVVASGIVLRDGRDLKRFINLWKVEDGEFNLISNDMRASTLVSCIGRTYPVKELSEWVTATRETVVFVPFDEYGLLVDMAKNSNAVYLQNRGEFIPCSMELSDKGEYLGKGRLTAITLTRIDEV